VQNVGQFIGVVAVGRSQDKGFHGGQQGAMSGEPDGLVGPQPLIIKAGDVGERVKSPAMRIAGEIAELLELAEHGESRIGAQHPFEFRKVSDFVAAQVLAEGRGVEGDGDGPHNVIVPTPRLIQYEL